MCTCRQGRYIPHRYLISTCRETLDDLNYLGVQTPDVDVGENDTRRHIHSCAFAIPHLGGFFLQSYQLLSSIKEATADFFYIIVDVL